MSAVAIVITDPPRVVELKREFRKLDEEDLSLTMVAAVGGDLTPEQVERLQAIRQRKVVIATEVFNHAEVQ